MSYAKEYNRYVGGVPDVGSGNYQFLEAALASTNLEASDTSIFVIKNLLVTAAKYRHSQLSSLPAALKYSSDNAQRHAAPARLLTSISAHSLHWRTFLQLGYSEMQNVHFITPQDMLAAELADRQFPVTLLIPDTRGKNNPKLKSPHLHALPWNCEAYHWLAEHIFNGYEQLTLIQPIDPRLVAQDYLPQSPTQRYNITPEDIYLIKISGSGGDVNLLGPLINTLKRAGTCPVLFTKHHRTHQRLHNSKVNFHSETDPLLLYALTSNATRGEPLNLIVTPSEQILHLAILSQEYPQLNTILLPPKGEHEVANTIFALENGLAGTICAPYEYHPTIRQIFIKSGYQKPLELVAPEQLTPNHLSRADRWNSPTNAVSFTEVLTM